MTILHAFFSPSSQTKTGSNFWVTLTGDRVRATHACRDKEMTDWREGRGFDEYGRPFDPGPEPADFYYMGEVDGGSHEWDVDHLHPDIVINADYYRDIYTKKYGRHDYTGPVGDDPRD